MPLWKGLEGDHPNSKKKKKKNKKKKATSPSRGSGTDYDSPRKYFVSASCCVGRLHLDSL
jgi:hypothetical protein